MRDQRFSLRVEPLWRAFVLSMLACGISRVAFSQVTVVSGASFAQALAPGSVGSIFGSGLAPTTKTAGPDAAGQLPTEIAGTSVLVAGKPSLLYYVSPGLINFVVPKALPAAQYDLEVHTGSSSLQGTITIATTAPALFSTNGRGAIVNAFTGAREPFDIGETRSDDGRNHLSVYLSGLNAEANVAEETIVEITSTGAEPIRLPVEYAGPQGTYPGLDQVNFALTDSLNGIGNVRLRVIRAGIASGEVALTIRDSVGPQVRAISPQSGPLYSEVRVIGNHFSPANSAGDPTATYVLLEQGPGKTAIVLPTTVSSEAVEFIVPGQPFLDGARLSGSVRVCVVVDEQKGCGSSIFVIQDSPPMSSSTGDTTLQYLNNLIAQQSQSAFDDGELDKAIESASLRLLIDIRDSAVKARAGLPASIPGFKAGGLSAVPLSVEDVKDFDAFLINSGALTLSSQGAASVKGLGLRLRQTSPRASGTADEEMLLDEARYYQAEDSLIKGLDTLQRSYVGKLVFCGIDVAGPLAGPAGVAAKLGIAR